MHKKTDLVYSFLHIPVDMVAVFAAFIVSYIIRGNGLAIYHLPYEDYLKLVYVIVPIWIIIFMLEGLYNSRYLFGTLQNMFRIGLSVLTGWAAFVVYLTFLKTEQTLVFPRLMLIYILVFGFLFVFIGRLLLRLVQQLLRSVGIGRRRLLLFGSGKEAEDTERILQNYPDVGVQFIKRVQTATPEELEKELKKLKIDELIVDDRSINDNRILDYIRAAQDHGIICHLVPNMFEVQASNVAFQTMAGVPLLTFRQTPLEGWGRIVKRLIDIIGALGGLIITSPFLLLTALAVKLTSPGPLVFHQQRLGRDGKHFNIYKFRSMYSHLTGDHVEGKTEEEVFAAMGRQDLVDEYRRDHKVKVDPRITPVGRFIRRTRLDELPQLFNVLKGDLSLVGPRPIRDFELPRYGRWQSYLFSIKPGLTGLWQVSGGNDISYEERVQLDAHYVQNWSLWQDITIIIKTILTILFGKSHGY